MCRQPYRTRTSLTFERDSPIEVEEALGVLVLPAVFKTVRGG